MKHNTEILKDLANRQLNITREFSAPVEKVWKAWTDSALLEKWWAPRPWRAETTEMDFKEGGLWLYCMAGPQGERAYCRVDFKTVEPEQSFTSVASFSDADGNIDKSFPSMNWQVDFLPTSSGSKIEVTLSFDSDADLEKIIEMQFEMGFTMALGNLDELLEA